MSLKVLSGFHQVMKKSLLNLEKDLITMTALMFWTTGREEPSCFMIWT